ncbi:alpha/beta hydrolase [Kitasatospora indigofera]|uniref:alpha/beta hydrolase n=1 Tax=Kitasatospora indigofera TaxID=67307 RepID=UPI0036928519
MTVDVRQLQNAQPARLHAAADAYDSLGRANGEHFEAVKEAVRWISHGGNWTGTAAEVATNRLNRTNTKLDGSHTAMQAMGVLLREAADAFELAQSKLLDAIDEAIHAGFTVSDDGAITYPPAAAADRHDPDYDAPKRAKSLADRINRALAEANSADQAVASRLKKITEGADAGYGVSPGAAGTDLNAAKDLGRQLTAAGWPPPDASAVQVHDWWEGLSQAEQQKIVSQHPDLVGNRDGIPCVARDQANRILLPRLIEQYRGKPQLSDEERAKLAGFENIQKRLDGGFEDGGRPGTDPPLFLMGIGDQGQGRAILSWGNPDTAKHVSALVPGLNSDLAGAGAGDASTALRIRQSADQAATANGGSPDNASIFWLGYDAPQLDGASVLTKDRAVEGAAGYDQFLTGLRGTHEGVPAHVTSIGHSYGSLLVGQAARRPGGLPADDVILVGSPGVGTDSASKLGVGTDHVYVGAAKADPVAGAPSRGLLIPGVAAYDSLTNPDGSWFGTDPASSSFGGQRFSVADGTFSDSHDNYFGKNGKGGDSLGNIGRIVSGNPQLITRQEGR